jgi:peptide/nickel transport system ATP-binding protein
MVRFDGVPWTGVPERVRRPLRHRVQAVQQDPLGSFDPRFDVERVIGRPSLSADRGAGGPAGPGWPNCSTR